MMNLSVDIGKAQFPNPISVASGTFGYVEEYFSLKDLKKLGAIIPKTFTLTAREGNPPLRIYETPAGMLNAIGLENKGADDFIQHKLSLYQKIGVPLIVSFSGSTDEEFVQIAKKMNNLEHVCALELNLSCPNLGKKILIAQDPAATARVIQAVKQVTSLPVIAKLSPNVTDIVEMALAAQEGGADGLSLINTFSAMAIDIEKRVPVLGNVTGGLSGPAIKPIAVYMVYQTARQVKIPIIAMGGIMNAQDALEFLIAGATMVAVGTANFVNPNAPWEVLQGVKDYMQKNKMKGIRELIGSINNRGQLPISRCKPE